MIAKTYSVTSVGIEGIPVEVQIDCKIGIPIFNIIGLAGRSLQEAKDRVVPALRNGGYEFRPQRIVVNLLPSDLQKNGTQFDLAIAIGYLQATRQISPQEGACYLGELGLDGQLLPLRNLNLLLNGLKDKGFSRIYIPLASENDITFDHNLPLVGVRNIGDVVTRQGKPLRAVVSDRNHKIRQSYLWDNVTGNSSAKKSMLVALAGGHNILLYGSPGTGKTMLASAALELLPPLTKTDAHVVSLVYERAHQTRSDMHASPIRQPHHSSSVVGLLGGGAALLPGEISLAHKGILYLDELSEFDVKVLESLRIPLTEGKITLAKSSNSTTLPAEFQLISTTNPCVCGLTGHPTKICECTDKKKKEYWRGLSSAIFDRIDIFTPMFHVEQKESAYISGQLAAKVIKGAREVQLKRQGKLNCRLSLSEMQEYSWFEGSWAWIQLAYQSAEVSMRKKLSLLKLARTIADIEERETIETTDLSLALRYSEGGKWS